MDQEFGFDICILDVSIQVLNFLLQNRGDLFGSQIGMFLLFATHCFTNSR